MDKVPPKQKKVNLTREELLHMEKEQLVDKIIQLEAHNFQLRNIINKNVSDGSKPVKGFNNQKQFNFTNSHTRPILLHILYFGWDYQGFVVQEDTSNTVEHHLFTSLTRACLIESRELAKYHRCGRTDKGVSAFGQIISINVRSKFHEGIQNDPSSVKSEIPYCRILNRLLPKGIRAVAWIPVPKENEGLSARFDCKKRQYKYYFPKSNLDIEAMRESCKLLVGNHDFRNFCKMDVGNGVVEYVRTILHADIQPVVDSDRDSPTSMYYLLIEGNAFLWHQIRCVMAILLLIGGGNETKDIIPMLLDHETYNRKPQYNLAIDVPLNLFKCSYDIEETNQWVYEKEELEKAIKDLQGEWTVQNIKSTMIKDCLEQLEAKYAVITHENEMQDTTSSESDRDRIIAYDECLTQGTKSKVYTPLLKRGTCSTLEEKIEHYKKRRKYRENE